MFITLGLCGLIPFVHFIISFGFVQALEVGGIGWLLLMAVLYVTGACLYSARIPERLFPGKFDIWVRSYYIFNYFYRNSKFNYYYKVSKSSNISCFCCRWNLRSLSWPHRIS